jgi:ribosomal protein L25 (general stress protein Ctc)
MSERIVIAGQNREVVGKNEARKLRSKGQIPANLLEKAKATSLSINPKWLSKVWQGDKIFDLDWNGTVRSVKIHELQIHPVKRTALHVDLVYV